MAGALKIKGLKTKKTEGVTKPGRRTESESSVTNSNERTTGLAVNKKSRPPEGPDQGSEGLISSSVEPEQAVEEERPRNWIHFGPTYGNDTEENQTAKDSAWLHILDKSGGDVTSSYLKSIVDIAQAAIDSYDSSAVEELKRTPQEFERLMVKDGCFFLQLALHILGAGDSLGYSQQHLYFGVTSDSSSWIPAMFYVGNQIPYVVINALMNQTFFKEVITTSRDKWLRPVHEEDLAKLALYQTVVESQLGGGGRKASDPPSCILQALHNLLVGPGDSDPISPEMRAFRDLETGIDDSSDKIPSAGELKKISIKLTKAKRGITNNVQFKNRIFFAHLHVPPLTIDTHTKDLLTSLVKLEQLVSEGDREVTAYLRFMRDLAPTYKDFKILQDRGIILVKDKELLCTMVHMLHNLVSPTESSLTLKFLNIRRGIKGYKGPPWAVIGGIISALTIIQTILAAVAYAFPRT